LTALEPTLIAACVATGGIAGFAGGLLGIGGGAIIVPALLLLFELAGLEPALRPPMAVATSLATVIFTSASAVRAQLRHRAIRWDVVRAWTPGLLVGSFASGYVARVLSADALAVFIGLFLAGVAGIMLARWRPKPHRELPGTPGNLALGAGAGLVSGLAGIGGGSVTVPTLVFFNVAVQGAVATSSTLGLPIAAFGTLGFVTAGWTVADRPEWSLGYVYLPAVAAIATATMLTAPLGVATSHRISAERLRRIFGGLLVLVSIRILAGALR